MITSMLPHKFRPGSEWVISGAEYADHIASYIRDNFGYRGLKVFREVHVGKSIFGKDRIVDIFIASPEFAMVIECKYQDSAGTTEEKIPFALTDLAALAIPSALVYAGKGWSDAAGHLLRSSSRAAYCMPRTYGDESPCLPMLDMSRKRRPHEKDTREMDQKIAETFSFWDLFTEGKQEWTVAEELKKYGKGKADETKTMF